MQLDLAQILSLLWRRRLSGALAFVLVAVGAATFYVLATPRYDATALISIGDDIPATGDTPRDKAIEQQLESIAVVASTDDVVRAAANRVGFDRLFAKRSDLPKAAEASQPPIAEASEPTEAEKLLPDLQRSISIKPLAKTNLIAISFGNADPVVAAEFANAVAEGVINRQIELSSHPGAVDFFDAQRAHYEANIKSASSALAKFVAENSIYSVKLQQELLMRRASELETALGSAGALVVERAAQKEALVQQLLQIKPVADSGLEANFLQRFGSVGNTSGAPVDKPAGASETLPLSLDRVYRDGLASLVNMNSELSGLHSRQSNLAAELNAVNADLSQLSASAAEFNRLERAVDAATANADIFERRTVDEAIGRDLAKARMSSLRIVQAAPVPFRPAFPSRRLMASAATVGGLLAAVAAALVMEMVSLKFPPSGNRGRSVASEAVGERRETA